MEDFSQDVKEFLALLACIAQRLAKEQKMVDNSDPDQIKEAA